MMPTKLRRKGRPRQRWEDSGKRDFRESGRRIKTRGKGRKYRNVSEGKHAREKENLKQGVGPRTAADNRESEAIQQ